MPPIKKPPGSEDVGKRPQTPSGEGERRAQRGFGPQYRMAASLIYDQLAAGQLRWIGVAHREAGKFDDLVLGLRDRVIGLQVKTSQSPSPFRLADLLLGAEKLWPSIVVGLERMATLDPPRPAAVIYACDDPPSVKDQVGDTPGSCSADLLDLHARHAADWTLADWDTTPFGQFVRGLQEDAGLADDTFLTAWRSVTFVTGGYGRLPGAAQRTPQDAARVEALAKILPDLVEDHSNRDRWEVAEVLARLKWRDAFGPRHNHRFPVPDLHQPNEQALGKLAEALARIDNGYLALIGPPGSGKSTLLAEGVLGAQATRIVRYLAFVPDGRTLGRGEDVEFLHDVIADLKLQGLGEQLWPGQSLTELREQFGTMLSEAGRRFETTGVRTLVIVDGLDHIPREQTVVRSLLAELPLPDFLPDGVIFLLGSQRLDLKDMPFAVQHQAGADGRCIPVPPLSPEAVFRWAKAAGIPEDVGADVIFERTQGHPLSTRYVIEGLAAQAGEDARATWLSTAPAYAGDIDAFYASAWNALGSQPDAKVVLAYLALADGPLRDNALSELTSPEAVEQTWQAARHLLRLDDVGALSLFHNSFRLFLQTKANERLGRASPALIRERFLKLAGMARTASADDPQRWLELRYQARADAEDDVLRLATPERFREQFIEGRRPAEIQDDLGLAFRAVANKRRADRILPLLLSRHEIDIRSEAVSDDVIDAYLNLGDRDAARGLLDTDGAPLSEAVVYRVIDADLAAGDVGSARTSFESAEPLEQLLGAKPVSDLNDEASLAEWAHRALAFRPATQVIQMLDRLVASEGVFRAVDLDAVRQRLKFELMDGELRRNPAMDPEALRLSLAMPDNEAGLAQLYGALASKAAGRPGEALTRAEAAAATVEDLDPEERRTLGVLAARLGRPDLAKQVIEGVEPPTLAPSTFRGDDDFGQQVADVLDFAELMARLDLPTSPATPPKGTFLVALLKRLETLGGLFGRIGAGEIHDDAASDLQDALRFVARTEGEDLHDFDRHRFDRVMGKTVARIVGAAVQVGPAALAGVLEQLDGAPETDWRLRQSEVRREYGLGVFRHDHDIEAARKRVAYVAGGERTPEGQLAEAARSASALAEIGLQEEARELLRVMHLEGCGLSQPAKKNPQYIGWSELLEQACGEDPDGREARVAFMTRFISGLSVTEGNDSGGRVLPEVLIQAAQGRSGLAQSVADRAQSLAELKWSGLISSLGRGVACRDPDLTLAAATVVGRVAAPFAAEYDGDPFEGLIALAPADQIESVAARILDVIETDTNQEVRLKFLEAAALNARDRGVEQGWETLRRWQAELPLPSSGSSPEDLFFHARTLDDVARLISNPEHNPWNATRAFARIAPDAGYAAARDFLAVHPSLLSDKRVLKTIGDLAIASGDREAAARHRDALHAMARDRANFDYGWSGGAKLIAWELDVALRGDVARREAFDAFLADLSAGWIWPAHLLQYLVDILRVIAPVPTWSQAWASLETHLSAFREHALGAPLPPTHPESPTAHDGIEVLADLLYRALDLGPSFLGEQVKLALLDLAGDDRGEAIVARLVERLLDGVEDEVLQGAQFAWMFRDAARLQPIIDARLLILMSHPDYGVRRIGRALGLVRGLPPALFAKISASGPTAAIPDASAYLSATWPVNRLLRQTAELSGRDLESLRARMAEIIAGSRVPPTPAVQGAAAGRASALDVFASQPKLIVRAAFRAQRILLTELIASGDIEPPDAEEVVHQCSVDAVMDHDLRSEPRPVGLCRPEFGEPYRDEHYEAWLEDVTKDLAPADLDGLMVVAGWGRHQSFARSADLTAEQVYGAIPEGDTLAKSLDALPSMLTRTRLILQRTAGARPLVRQLIGGAFWRDSPSIGLCPVLAADLGWRPDPRNPTRFVDGDGDVMVRTLTWRDSGCVGRLHGETVLRQGQLIVASAPAADRLSGLPEVSGLARAWRSVKRGSGPTTTSVASSRMGASRIED